MSMPFTLGEEFASDTMLPDENILFSNGHSLTRKWQSTSYSSGGRSLIVAYNPNGDQKKRHGTIRLDADHDKEGKHYNTSFHAAVGAKERYYVGFSGQSIWCEAHLLPLDGPILDGSGEEPEDEYDLLNPQERPIHFRGPGYDVKTNFEFIQGPDISRLVLDFKDDSQIALTLQSNHIASVDLKSADNLKTTLLIDWTNGNVELTHPNGQKEGYDIEGKPLYKDQPMPAEGQRASKVKLGNPY